MLLPPLACPGSVVVDSEDVHYVAAPIDPVQYSLLNSLSEFDLVPIDLEVSNRCKIHEHKSSGEYILDISIERVTC